MHANSQSYQDIRPPQDGPKNQSKAKHCSSFFNMLLDVAGEGEAFAKESTPISLPARSGAGQSVNLIHTDSSSCPDSSAICSVAPPLSSIHPVAVAAKGSLDEELKIQETALISSAVKELSDDPLVQLSMLRAMQNQQVTPDMLRKNMAEREATRAGSVRQRQSTKRKSTVKAAAQQTSTGTVITSQQEEDQQTSIEVACQSVYQPMRSDSGSTPLHPNSILASQGGSKAAPVTSQEELLAVLANAMTLLNNIPSSHGLEVPHLIDLNATQRALVMQQSILLSLQPQVHPQELSHQQQLLSAFLLAAWERQVNISAGVSSLLGNLLLQHRVPSHQQLGGTQQEVADRIIRSSEHASSRNVEHTECIVEPTNGAPISWSKTPSLSRKHSTKRKHTDLSKRYDPVNTQFVRIPCRARRMPADHNFKVCRRIVVLHHSFNLASNMMLADRFSSSSVPSKQTILWQTAFFLLATDRTNIVHGQDLKCSHPSCRASGVKFRYCKVCDIPVAKRAFWRKHIHEEGQETVPSSGHLREVVVVVDDQPPLSSSLSSSASSSLSSRLPHHKDDPPPPIPRSITCVTPPSTSVSKTSFHPSASHPPPTSRAITMMMSPQTTTITPPALLQGLSENDPSSGCKNGSLPHEEDLDFVTGGETKEEPNKRQRTEGQSTDIDRSPCVHKSQRRHRRLPIRRRDDDQGGIMAVSTSTATTTTTTTTTNHYHHHHDRCPKDSLQRRMTLWTDLLSQRPKSPQNNEEAMSRWLMMSWP